MHVAGDGENGETVTIGAYTFELDTEIVPNVTPGNIAVDVSGGTTEFSQATLTVDTWPTVTTDTMTIGYPGATVVYTFRGDLVNPGDIDIGGNLGECQANIVAAINGTDGINSPHPACTIAAFGADDAVLTAIVGGTDGDAIIATETFTAESNVFDGGGTFGGTNAGVDPIAEEVIDALVIAFNLAVADYTAVKVDATEMLVSKDDVGVDATACTASGSFNGTWSAATMSGGHAALGTLIRAISKRVPTANEVTEDHMIFMFDFTPDWVEVDAKTTATGAVIRWDGNLTITANKVIVTNAGAVDWAATDTVIVKAYAYT